MKHLQTQTLRHIDPIISKRIQTRYHRSTTLWQPNDVLPFSFDTIKELQRECKDLPRDILVTLVGDMVTEAALPSYTMTLNTLGGGMSDSTGEDTHTWQGGCVLGLLRRIAMVMF